MMRRFSDALLRPLVITAARALSSRHELEKMMADAHLRFGRRRNDAAA